MAGRTRSPATDRRAGFVLIEAVATLVIALLLLSFAYPLVAAGTTQARLAALVGSSAALLRDARTAALVTGHLSLIHI